MISDYDDDDDNVEEDENDFRLWQWASGQGGSMGGCQRLMLPRPYQVPMSLDASSSLTPSSNWFTSHQTGMKSS